MKVIGIWGSRKDFYSMLDFTLQIPRQFSSTYTLKLPRRTVESPSIFFCIEVLLGGLKNNPLGLDFYLNLSGSYCAIQ